MKHFLCILLTVILFSGIFPDDCRAQMREMKQLSTSDGLTDLLVNTIYKDSRGFVWFGTESGIDRFDGNQIVSYYFPKKLRGSCRVHAILRNDETGNIYIGTQTGLWVLTPGLNQLEQIFADKIDFPVSSITSDGPNDLYIGTQQGVFHLIINRNTIAKLDLSDGSPAPVTDVSGLFVRPGRELWVATAHKLYYLDLSNGKQDSYPIPGEGECTLMVRSGKTIYLGLRGIGLQPFDMATREFGKVIHLGNNLVTSVTTDADGNIFAATDGDGIFFYSIVENKIKAHISTASSLPALRSNSVYSVLMDDLGLLWIGYYQMGAEYTPNLSNLFSVYSIPKVFDSYKYAVRAFAMDGPLKLIGTRDGLFVVDESKGRLTRFLKPQLRSNIIFAITQLDNIFYIGTYEGGMYSYNPGTGALTDMSGVIPPTASVFAIVPDSRGDLWVGTSEGLYRFGSGKLKGHWTFTNSQLPKGNIYEIFFDSTGRGWICTENGMAIWDGTTIRADRFPSGFANGKKIRDIFEDSDHQLYFSPDRGSLFTSDLQMSRFGNLNYGVDGNITTMFTIEDNDGYLWFGTDRGAIRYNKKDEFTHFNNADGLPHQVFTLCQPFKDAEGNLWLGNNFGLTVLDFHKLKKQHSAEAKPLAVTNLMSNGRNIASRLTGSGKNLAVTLSGKETDIVIYPSDFGFKPSENFVTEYLFEKSDGKWHRTSGTTPVHIYDIPSGTHRLTMRVLGNPATETVLTITREKSFNWAIIAIATALVLVAYTLFNIYQHKRRRRLEEEERFFAEATAPQTTSAAEEPKKAVAYRTTRLSDEECKRLLRLLVKIMNTDKPYTNPDMKSSDLASMAGTSSHALSFLFNQYLHKSYYDFVNEYRVNEFKRLVNETDISRYTLTALSEQCGFSSRASFFRHFKAITGITPAEFIKRK